MSFYEIILKLEIEKKPIFYNLQKIIESQNKPNFPFLHLQELFNSTKNYKSALILELGVDKGISTRIFYDAIKNKKNSQLISVDIKDFSNTLAGKNKWKFIQGDSSEIQNIIKKAPEIKKRGIDILFIDSLHTVQHIKKELYGFFPYVNKGGVIFFDDVDPSKYSYKQPKDSISFEITNRKIREFLKSIFVSNDDKIDLSFFNGSTGLARMRKYSVKNIPLNEPRFIKPRKIKIFWKIFYFLFSKKKEYKKTY